MVDVACSVTSYSDDDSSVRQAARVNDDVTADVTDDVTDDGNTMSAITCCLETKELWEQFHQLGTEMIITKSGRYTYTHAHYTACARDVVSISRWSPESRPIRVSA